MNIYDYINRVTTSRRGEKFNPLIWPFLIGTFIYGVAFVFLSHTESINKSSLYVSMQKLWVHAPHLWGALAILVIVIGVTFLMFNIPPAGKLSGLLGFALWIFAAFCWAFNDGWILVCSVAIPNLWFWFWQYLSLSLFREEDAEDKATMHAYNTGQYDENRAGRGRRKTNRGVDKQ